MRLALTLLTLAILLAPAVSHSSSLVVFYNGSVEAKLYGVSSFNLVGHNVTPIKVVGSKFRIVGGTIYFTNGSNVTLSYVASLSSGVVSIDEPYELNITVFLPSTSTITYMSPVPEGFSLRGGDFELSFYSNNVTVLYYPSAAARGAVSQSAPQPNYALIYALVASLVGVNGFLGFSLLKLLRERRKVEVAGQAEVRTEVQEASEEAQVEARLNDRDLLVLEAINKGYYTLSEIMKYTKLPKTTTYRRLKKLVSLGYVEEVKKEGRTFYIPKNRSGTSS